MVRSFNSGVSGLQQFQQRMDVIGNNIANVHTTGYKTARAEFSDTFSETLRSSGSSGSMQVGTGVATASIHSKFTQGSREVTGNDTDVTISGEGFFIVKDTSTNVEYATRSGNFSVDKSGYLTLDGKRVQGYSTSDLTTRGDIRIDNTNDGATPHAYLDPPTNSQPATMDSYYISNDGKIHVVLADGNNTDYVRGQILLQQFSNPNALVKEGDGLYSGMDAAGGLAATTAPGSLGLGELKTGELESSNVDLTQEMTDLITTQRAFQASSRIITTSDEMLQDVIGLKR